MITNSIVTKLQFWRSFCISRSRWLSTLHRLHHFFPSNDASTPFIGGNSWNCKIRDRIISFKKNGFINLKNDLNGLNTMYASDIKRSYSKFVERRVTCTFYYFNFLALFFLFYPSCVFYVFYFIATHYQFFIYSALQFILSSEDGLIDARNIIVFRCDYYLIIKQYTIVINSFIIH